MRPMWPLMFMVLFETAAGPVTIAQPARATGRIYNGARVTEKEWRSDGRRAERVVSDEQGRKIRVRVIEFE